MFESSSYLAGEAILRPAEFLVFQDLLAHIRVKLTGFSLWNISYAHLEGNRCAHEIALSVTRDHRYQSYIARGGPFWLRTLTLEDAKDDTWSHLVEETFSLIGLVFFFFFSCDRDFGVFFLSCFILGPIGSLWFWLFFFIVLCWGCQTLLDWALPRPPPIFWWNVTMS